MVKKENVQFWNTYFKNDDENCAEKKFSVSFLFTCKANYIWWVLLLQCPGAPSQRSSSLSGLIFFLFCSCVCCVVIVCVHTLMISNNNEKVSFPFSSQMNIFSTFCSSFFFSRRNDHYFSRSLRSDIQTHEQKKMSIETSSWEKNLFFACIFFGLIFCRKI